MTREEAKTIFLNRGYIEVDGGSYFDGNKWRESIAVITEWLKEESCADAISRQAVLDAISSERLDYTELYDLIKHLSSVTPQPKIGHWIVHPKSIYAHLVCDKCLSSAPYDCKTNYCPNCGAKMTESEVQDADSN